MKISTNNNVINNFTDMRIHTKDRYLYTGPTQFMDAFVAQMKSGPFRSF